MRKKKEKNFSKRGPEDYGWWTTFWQMLWVRFSFYPFYKLMYKMKVNGKENIPNDRSFLVASNHVSLLDPPLLSAAFMRPIGYMAKRQLFDIFFIGPMIWTLGAFAVNREKLAPSTIKTAKAVLSHKVWMMALFPQGGRRRNNKIETITKGFASLAKTTKTDILPVGIIGAQNTVKIPLTGNITVNIGTPISYKLDTDEIVVEWARQVSELAQIENEYEVVASSN